MVSAEQYAAPSPLPPVRGMPGLVADLCLRCLSVDPAQRPSSADMFSCLASVARSGDRRSRYSTVTTAIAVEHRGNAGRASVGRSRRGRGGAFPPGGGTRIMPHGVHHLTDPDAATVPTGELVVDEDGVQTRRRPVFMLPTILLTMLIGCVGLAELRPGDGGVSAAPPLLQPPSSTAPARPAVTPTPTRSPTTRPALVDPDTPRVACHVDYRVTSEWGIGFSAQLAVANLGRASLSGWKLEFTLGSGQRVVDGWNGVFQQRGRKVTVRSTPYNGSVAPGDQVQLGFLGISRDQQATAPGHFTLNGTDCD